MQAGTGQETGLSPTQIHGNKKKTLHCFLLFFLSLFMRFRGLRTCSTATVNLKRHYPTLSGGRKLILGDLALIDLPCVGGNWVLYDKL